MDVPNGPYVVLTVVSLVGPDGRGWRDESIAPDQKAIHPLTDALLWLDEQGCSTGQ